LPTRALTALLLSDGKPGHYHQAEGVLAAMARQRAVNPIRMDVHRRFIVPTRVLHQLINAGVAPGMVLRLGYRIDGTALPAADLVVSAGGETLAANAAAARLLGAVNIFCGRLRRLAPAHVRLAIVSLERFAGLPNHLVCLPPSPIEPRATARVAHSAPFGPGNPPRIAGLLVGGNSGRLRYREADWQRLAQFMREAHRQFGIGWMATTSRRSGAFVGDTLAAMAGEPGGPIIRFIDYRTAGPGALAEIFAQSDAILCTEDSTTMISEAVGAGLPVVTVGPDRSRLEAREVEYRQFLEHQGWYRPLKLAALTPNAFLGALAQVRPRKTSQLDELATALGRRLPDLFARP
jgi:uncharacterized protein